MKHLICILLAMISLSSLAKTPLLSYSFGYDTLKNELKVRLTFKGSPSGKTVLTLPDEWAGQDKLYQAIKLMSVTGGKSMLDPVSDSAKRTVTHTPNASITLEYTVNEQREGEFSYPMNFRAVTEKQFFQFTGYSLLVIPETEQGMVAISLDWTGLPSNWSVTNSFHSGSRKYKGKVLVNDFKNSLFTAGSDFRTYETDVKGKPVFVTLRGSKWTFSDSVMVDRVKAIIAMERAFWKDFSEGYYCVSLIPFDGNGSANGTSLHRAFMLAMTYEQPLQEWLLAHEYFHRWNGTTIRIKEDVEQEHSWFSEGVTEYYTYKLLFENGIISRSEYVQQVNDMIAAYYLSPVRNVDRVTQGKNYWGSRDFQNIPYKKGFVYALWLDNKIRSHGPHKLDDLMYELNALKMGKDTIPYPVFESIVNKYAGNIYVDQHNYIDLGETIPVAAESLGSDVILERKELGTFDAGFDVRTSMRGGIIAGVTEGSAAWNAGLRDGQEILAASMENGVATQRAEFKVSENGTEKEITYFPMSVDKISVPQFVLRK